MTGSGHLLPVVTRKSRQLITQKPPVTEQNVTPAEVPPKAAERRLAEEGQEEPYCEGFRMTAHRMNLTRVLGPSSESLQ